MLMDAQEAVAAFIRENNLGTPPDYRMIDLVSEVGEVAKDATEPTDYGTAPDEIEISVDELGDVLLRTPRHL